ncbi:MAG: hypothetical protein GY841_17970 [FCB group bacterium]|nr:hypothetical protein [FCB group bacterium]
MPHLRTTSGKDIEIAKESFDIYWEDLGWKSRAYIEVTDADGFKFQIDPQRVEYFSNKVLDKPVKRRVRKKQPSPGQSTSAAKKVTKTTRSRSKAGPAKSKSPVTDKGKADASNKGNTVT